MAKTSKRIKKAREQAAQQKTLPLAAAIDALLAQTAAKFDESIDIAIRLGVDPRHADQMVRGMVSLPHGTGKKIRVLVFAKGAQAEAALAAGADIVGDDDLVKKVQDGFMDFDVTVATPDMMAKVGRLGRVLGPRGLMPNPKLGTVTPNAAKAVGLLKAGQIQVRVEKNGIVHAPVGKRSFSSEQLVENVSTLLAELNRMKPAVAKGRYMQMVSLSATMGASVHVDLASF
ncbi:MAG: 50S ribosomal protein L1 [Mariprofundales bacterium]